MEYEASILLVDDDPKVINSLKRILNKREYRLLSATTSKDAIHILQNNKIDLLICDQKMPGILGIEILKYSKTIQPDMIRILITGYSDIDVITQAINEGSIFYYFAKPWNNKEVISVVEKALEYKREQEGKKSLYDVLTFNKEHLMDVSNKLNFLNDLINSDSLQKAGESINKEGLDYIKPDGNQNQHSLNERAIQHKIRKIPVWD